MSTQLVELRSKSKVDHDDLVKEVVDRESQVKRLVTEHAAKVDEYEKHVKQLGLDHSTEVDDHWVGIIDGFHPEIGFGDSGQCIGDG